jgi:hypothetical protein
MEDISSWRLVMTQCRHIFHSKCINQWLNTNSTCPICRASCVGIHTLIPSPTIPKYFKYRRRIPFAPGELAELAYQVELMRCLDLDRDLDRSLQIDSLRRSLN